MSTPSTGQGDVSIFSRYVDMMSAVRGMKNPGGQPLDLRIGIHAGPVVAGVIGQHKFAGDLRGDTVNTASRMEAHGAVGRIQVTASMHRALAGRYRFEERGKIAVKGIGERDCWYLVGPV